MKEMQSNRERFRKTPLAPPQFGFFCRFLVGAASFDDGRGFDNISWGKSNLRVWERGAARLCVARNPRLDELHLCQTSKGVAVLDARIDALIDGSGLCKYGREKRICNKELLELIRGGDFLTADRLKRIIGDFAIVDWDDSGRILRLCRDPFGARSLFYQICDGIVSLASDLGTLVSQLRGPFVLDQDQARAWLVGSGTPVSLPDRTALHGVMRVAPGTIVEIDRSGVRIERFWGPGDAPSVQDHSLSDSVEILRQVLSRAVSDRIPQAGFPFASHLSGGLDCSTICGLIAKDFPEAAKRCEFVSWSPLVPHISGPTELDIVERLARAWKINVMHLSEKSLKEELLNWSETRFDPSVNLTMAAFEKASLRAISRDSAVMMSGWGGDEFASSHGWGAPMELIRRGRYSEFGLFLIRTDRRHGIAAILSSIYRCARWLLPASARFLLKRLRKARDNVNGDPFEYRTLDVNYHSSVRSCQESAYWSGHLVDRIEAWASVGRSMGVQYVYPLLDRRVVELALSFPGSHFRNFGESRCVFRRMANQFWPDGLASRARKYEPGLANFVTALFQYSWNEKGVDVDWIKTLCERPDVFDLLPTRMKKVVLRGGGRKGDKCLRSLKEGLELVLHSLEWIRLANESVDSAADGGLLNERLG